MFILSDSEHLKKIYIFRAKIFILLILSFLIFGGKCAVAQEIKSYNYNQLNVFIKINTDSTFNVIEEQIYNYTGVYHEAWRSILLNKVDAITDIEVIDGENEKPFVYSGSELDKTRPESWGKFTYNKKNGKQNIIWYYDVADAKHKWIIKYKVHGGLEFGKSADRLYWNIFTDFTVPVKEANVNVVFPKGVTEKNAKVFSYRNKDILVKQEFIYNNSVFFKSSEFYPNEAFTIDIGWPKGIISRADYWKDFFNIYYGYIFSLLSFIICALIGFVYWLKNEKLKKGRGTIIPEYQPPRNLKPAMAEIIVKEKITSKGLTATIVDLAIRGYVKIEEDKSVNQIFKNIMLKANNAFKIFKYIIILLFIIFLLIILFSNGGIADKLFFLAPLILIIFLFKLKIVSQKDYIVLQNKPFREGPGLEEYEKDYLELLLTGGKFSTRGLRRADSQTKKDFFEATKELKKTICKETELDTNAFEIGPSKEIILGNVISSVFVVAVVGLFLLFNGTIDLGSASQMIILIFSLLLSIVGLWLFIKYEARLNQDGRILKEEWLGFKMYLETAERYRMQNLTPDIFEKYLPYAMIFGVEKKWARAFESVNMAAPSWYGGSGGYAGGGASSSFSPSVFSASFSSSFSSAFASSGAGGGGAGGGGAGGGGGGGGGGAS